VKLTNGLFCYPLPLGYSLSLPLPAFGFMATSEACIIWLDVVDLFPSLSPTPSSFPPFPGAKKPAELQVQAHPPPPFPSLLNLNPLPRRSVSKCRKESVERDDEVIELTFSLIFFPLPLLGGEAAWTDSGDLSSFPSGLCDRPCSAFPRGIRPQTKERQSRKRSSLLFPEGPRQRQIERVGPWQCSRSSFEVHACEW